MHKRRLPIATPCFEDWDAMQERGGGRRFCESCSETVHNLSDMTQDEASALLERRRDTATFCIRYRSDAETGEVLFREPSVIAPPPSFFVGWRGLALGLAGLALSACTDPNPEPTEIHESECVFDHGMTRYTVPRGEGDCPPAAPARGHVAARSGSAPPPPPTSPSVVEPKPPEAPCEPPAIEPEAEAQRKVTVKGKRVIKKKRIKKRQGKKISLADDEPIQGLMID